ncbi:hypothetical protein NDU88_008482 [Pleurodeles waltl]|uniref:Uncharacterized protein n=1 Tax=Pleurodeles waltl TaxID=8319 RepID=A0AAV7NW57_PLEWA|nr:hypothetical protein NDU88_008482 [Pleurodeles waltl]
MRALESRWFMRGTLSRRLVEEMSAEWNSFQEGIQCRLGGSNSSRRDPVQTWWSQELKKRSSADLVVPRVEEGIQCRPGDSNSSRRDPVQTWWFQELKKRSSADLVVPRVQEGIQCRPGGSKS